MTTEVAEKPSVKFSTTYQGRLKASTDKQVAKEIRRQGRLEDQKRNFHGSALATVLEVVFKSHLNGAKPYLR